MDRRCFLKTTGGGVMATLAGCLTGRTDELGREISDLEAELDEKNETIANLRDERDELKVCIASKSEAVDDVETTPDEIRCSDKALRPEHDFTDGELDAALDAGIELRESVVIVHATEEAGAAGVHIGNGRYATVDHIFTDVSTPQGFPKIQTFSGGFHDVTREKSGEDLDLRVIESDHAIGPTVDHSTHDTVREGDVVFTVGHPLSVGRWIISIGRVVEEVGSQRERRYTIDMPTQLGNSGAPVFALDGDVIGMATHATFERDSGYTQPDEVFVDFHGYEPNGRVLPADLIDEQLRTWGY